MLSKRLLFFVFLFVLFSSCEKKNDSIIDPVYNSPILSNAFLSKDTCFSNSQSPLINLSASVRLDLNGGADIKNITCKLITPQGDEIFSVNMKDDGVLPDTTTNDGVYTCTINAASISCLLVGNYNVKFIAENNSNLFSNIISKLLIVKNPTNLAPVLSNLSIPDSVVRPLGGSFDITLSLTAIDSNGVCDIDEVSFDAYRPTGNWISKFIMTTTGSNVYTYTAPVTPSTPDSSYGYYKYIFNSRDKSSAVSNTIIDSIKFVRP